MNKSDLIDIVAKQSHLTKKAASDAVDAFLNQVQKSVKKGEKVVISGFGTFRLGKVKDKKGRKSPNDPTPVVHKGHKVIRFTVAKQWRKEVK